MSENRESSSYLSAFKRSYWTTRNAAGMRLYRIGERLGVDALTYNPVVMDLFAHVATQAAPAFAAAVVELLPSVRSAVDLGCGTGHFVHALGAAGIDSCGFEHSSYARTFAKQRLGITLRPFDLTEPRIEIPTAHLAMSLEVAEHLSPEMGRRLVALLTESAPTVIFSAATPGQGGMGHINEQPAASWQARFAERGYIYDEPVSVRLRGWMNERAPLSPWLGRNCMVFSAPPVAGTPA